MKEEIKKKAMDLIKANEKCKAVQYVFRNTDLGLLESKFYCDNLSVKYNLSMLEKVREGGKE
jgi:hypothetical protein